MCCKHMTFNSVSRVEERRLNTIVTLQIVNKSCPIIEGGDLYVYEKDEIQTTVGSIIIRSTRWQISKVDEIYHWVMGTACVLRRVYTPIDSRGI